MTLLLKLKHWQIFIILLLASFMSRFTWVGNEFLNTVLNLIGTLLYMIWYFAIGLEITERLPKKVELPKTLFIINGFVVICSFVTLAMFFDGSFESNGLLGFIWVVYFMYALFQFFFYPAKALNSNELEKEAGFGDYFGDFFLMLFWPIGIWWIQPRLNKIAENID
ncbi:MAG: hypothetical protein R8G66_30980 [Cytophagales bacterium]|nr:hypothetical protein [Cytophagales bacterium]